ncbi:MAG: hypothetical protein AB7O47_07240 [Flavobacteriales bacterium]
MDFYQLLDEKHCKSTTNRIVDEVVTSPDRINELIELFLSEDVRISQRAAWPISYIAEKKPNIIEKNLKKLFLKFEQKNVHDACIRNTFRCFQYINIPVEMEGIVLTKAFEYLNNPLSTVAVKVFCMGAIEKLIKKYPEIKNEFKTSIKTQLNEGSTGFKNRGNKILKRLK